MRKILFYFLMFFLVLCGSFWLVLHSEVFWGWVGHKLVAVANEQIQGKLTVEKINGTPFSGFAFQEIRLTGQNGEVFQTKGFMLRLSLWSMVRLTPVIDKLALYEPVLSLEQNQQGQWNLTELAPPQEGPSSQLPLYLRSLTFSEIEINHGKVLVKQPGGSQRIEDLNVQLSLKVEEPFSPQRQIEVGASQIAATTPWGRYTLETSLTYATNHLKLGHMDLASEGQRVLSLTGDLSLDSGMVSHLTGDIGPVPPTLIGRFFDQWPSSWKVTGKFDVQGKPSDLQFTLNSKVHQATFDVAGRLTPAKEPLGYDLTVKMANISPEMLSALNVPRGEIYCEASPLSVKLILQGSGLGWPPPEFSWQLQAEPFTVGSNRVDKVEIKAAGTAARQTLDAVLCATFGGIGLKSQGSFFTSPKGEIKLLVDNFAPGLIGLTGSSETIISADFDGRFDLPDPKRPDSLIIGGAVKASGFLEGHPLNSIQGNFIWEKPKLSLQGIQAEAGNLAVEITGSLDGDRLYFTHRGKTLAGGDWPVPAAVTGEITWNGTLEGSMAEPRYTLQAKGRSVAAGSVTLASFALSTKGLGLPPRSGALEVRAGSVKTPAGAFPQIILNTTGEGGRWRYHLKASSPSPGPLVELGGSVDLGTRPIFLLVDRLNLHLAGVSIQNRGQVQARFLPGLEMPPAAFIVNGGTVQLTARLEGGQVSARLEVRQLPLEIAKIKGVKGFLQSQLTVSGSAQSPVVSGTVSLAAVHWQQFAFKAIDTAMDYRGGVLKINGKLQGPEGIRLSWDGKIPLQLSLQPFRFSLPSSGLDFALKTEEANLKLLAKLTPEISRADLPVDLLVRVKGDWRQPEVEAHIRWQQGSITLTQAGIPYGVAPGTINWQGKKLSLPQLTLESGGTVVVSGDVDFQGYQPRMVRARAILDNFKVLERLASEALVNGEINLTGPFAALVLRGRLFIPKAVINPALIRPSTRQNPDIVMIRQKKADKAKKEQARDAKPEVYKNMTIDLSLEAPQNVWIKQKTSQVKADVELTVDVRARKRPGEELAVGGLVRSLEGNVDVFNKEFKVEKAIVTLPGVPDRQPFIEARASHEMTDAVLLVDISGPMNKPQIDLSSTPPMPANDLMSYLLFGRPAGDLSQQEFNAQQQAVGVLGGITASKIQEILGDDFPILGDINVQSTAGSIGLTKTLVKGVNVSVERRTSPTAKEDPTVVRLQYRINRYLRLQAEQGARNTGGDVIFRYDF